MTSKYQFSDQITIGKKYNDLLPTIHTPEDAAEYLEACIEHCMRFGNTREQAEEIERSNIGYVAGYFSIEEAARIHQLFDVAHPFLGKASTWAELTPEQIIQTGIDAAKKS